MDENNHASSNQNIGSVSQEKSNPHSDPDVSLSLSTKPKLTVCQEMIDLIKLSLPLAITFLSWVGMATTDTAVVGHLGTHYLSAAAMADLWTSSTGVFISGGVLSFFCGQSIGAKQPLMAGVWLQVSLCVLSVIAIAVMVSWACTGEILRAMGEPSKSASRSEYYACVLAVAIPARIGLGQASQFYQAQKITTPSLRAGLFSMVLNAILQIMFVLGLGINSLNVWRMGWPGLPVVTTSVTYFQLILFLKIAPTSNCWNGWNLKQNVTYKRVKEFSLKYFPAALSSASDWWRVVVIGIVAASLGDVDLAVFNSSYRILWMCLILTGSLATATGIKMSVALGAADVRYARTIANIGVFTAMPLLCGLSLLVITNSNSLAHIFSHDPEVIQLYHNIRWPLAGVVVTMNLSVMFERMAISMGRSELVLVLGIVGSWVAQVPLVLLCTQCWRNDLVGLYTGVALGYFILDMLFIYFLFFTSWEQFVVTVQDKESNTSFTPRHPKTTHSALYNQDGLEEEDDEDDKDDDSLNTSNSFV